MIKVGITGQDGFLGKNLSISLNLYKDKYEVVPFYNDYFYNDIKLINFVTSCDIIVHLAAKSRHINPNMVYDLNMGIIKKLIWTLEITNSKAHILYSSSIQEDMDTPYAKSKKEGRELLAEWCKKNGSLFTGFIFPNIFGPYCKPYYASFIATFCHQIINNETPKIDVDRKMGLIYVDEVMHIIIEAISKKINSTYYKVEPTSNQNVSEVLLVLQSFNESYKKNKDIKIFESSFEKNLFDTFKSYFP